MRDMNDRSFPGSAATWAPAQTVLRARMAALARSAQTAGAEISAAGRRGFLGKFGQQARELVEARLAKGERIEQVEAEVARVAGVLLKMHMTDLSHRPRRLRQARKAKLAQVAKAATDPPDLSAQKDRPALGSHETVENPLPRSRYVLRGRPSTSAQLSQQSPHPTVRVPPIPPREM